MAEVIAGIEIPDSRLVSDATALVREAEDDLLYHHSRRVFLFAALHGKRLGLEPEVALLTAGVETDVLGFGYEQLDRRLVCEITEAHPRPNFKTRILAAFTEGNVHRPATTLGNVNADVLERFSAGFERGNFVDIIEHSAWPE